VAELHRLGRAQLEQERCLYCFAAKEKRWALQGRATDERSRSGEQAARNTAIACVTGSLTGGKSSQSQFTVNAPDNVWCGDITFIRTQAGWLYLAVVLDLYARKVVGWAFSSVADSQLAQNALTMAWENRAVQKD
jgi:putative transposase